MARLRVKRATLSRNSHLASSFNYYTPPHFDSYDAHETDNQTNVTVSYSAFVVRYLSNGQQFRKYASAMIATAMNETTSNRLTVPGWTARTAEKSIPHASQYGA